MTPNNENLFMFDEKLELLSQLEKESCIRKQKVLTELLKNTRDSSAEHPTQNGMDINQINTTFKSLNAKVPCIEHNLLNFNNAMSQKRSPTQIINVGRVPEDLNLTDALRNVAGMKTM